MELGPTLKYAFVGTLLYKTSIRWCKTTSKLTTRGGNDIMLTLTSGGSVDSLLASAGKLSFGIQENKIFATRGKGGLVFFL